MYFPLESPLRPQIGILTSDLLSLSCDVHLQDSFKTQLLFLASVHVRLRVLELWGKPLIRDTIGAAEGILSAAGQTAWLADVGVGTFLPFFVLEEEAGKGFALFGVGEQQLLAWVGPSPGDFDLLHHDGPIGIVH